jgi:MerR family transcriptional regulator/heat shock protein HspR
LPEEASSDLWLWVERHVEENVRRIRNKLEKNTSSRTDIRDFVSSSDPIFTVGVAAQRAGVSEATLRLYDREGLVQPSKSRSGRRLYSVNDLLLVERVRELIHEQGLNFAGIRAFYSCVPCWRVNSCPETAKKTCPVYQGRLSPCWTRNGDGNARQRNGCESCEVYSTVARISPEKLGSLWDES